MDNKKRNIMLIGFGGLAIVLVAVFLVYQPSFPPDHATGAIGAVQKHRATQISQSDVILGDEASRKAAKVVAGDYLDDAVKLSNFATQVAAINRDTAGSVSRDVQGAVSKDVQGAVSRDVVGAKDAVYAREVADALGAHEAALYQRYADGLGAVTAAFQQRISADVTLGMQQRQGMMDRLGALSRLGSQKMDVASMEKANAELGALTKGLFSRNADVAEASLGALTQAWQAKAQVSPNELNVAAAQIATLGNDLRSMQAGFGVIAQVNQMKEIAAEAKIVGAAHDQLAAFAQGGAGMKAEAIGSISKGFLGQAEKLEAMAATGLAARLDQDSALAMRLARDQELAGAISKAGSVARDAATFANFDHALALFTQLASGMKAEVAARAIPDVETQLGIVQAYINARAEAQTAGIKAAAVEAKVVPDAGSRTRDVAARDQMALARTETADAFSQFFSRIENTFGSKNAYASLVRDAGYGSQMTQTLGHVEQLAGAYSLNFAKDQGALGKMDQGSLGKMDQGSLGAHDKLEAQKQLEAKSKTE